MGGVWTTAYDAAGNVARETDALGRSVTYAYDALDRLRTYSRPKADTAGQRLAQTYAYDLAGNVVSFKEIVGKDLYDVDVVRETKTFYDVWNRVTAVHLPDPTTGAASSGNDWAYAYYEASGVTVSVDPLNRENAVFVDKLGRTISVVEQDRLTGNAVDIDGTDFDKIGPTTDYVYDALGRVTDVYLPDPDKSGDLARPRYHTDYDALGRAIRTVAPNKNANSVADAYAGYAVYPTGHGSAGQPVTGAAVTDYFYDAAGRTTQVLSPVFKADVSGTPTDARRSTVYTYDELARLYETAVGSVEAADPETSLVADDQVTRYEYDLVGNLTSTTARPGTALEQVTQTEYDALNRPILQIDAQAGETRVTYDAVGNRTGLTDAVGNTTAWEYDRRDRAVRETDALLRRRLFAYDDVDRLTGRTDKNDNIRSFAYDMLDRNTQETWSKVSNATVTGTNQYDYDLMGRVTYVTGPQQYANSYQYDQRDNLTQSTQFATDRWAYVLDNEYDDLDRRTSQTLTISNWGPIYPIWYTATGLDYRNTYTYDSRSRLTVLEQTGRDGETPVSTGSPYSGTYPGSSWVYDNGVMGKRIEFTYNDLDQWTKVDRSTTDTDISHPILSDYTKIIETSYLYDAFGRTTEITHDTALTRATTAFNPSNGSIASFTYTYDALNRMTSETSVDGTSVFDYDLIDQLIGADHTGANLPGDEEYEYDPNGNRTDTSSGGTPAGDYSTGGNNQLESGEGWTFTYDAEGNRLTAFGHGEYRFFEYDHRNRLTQITWRANSSNVSQITQRVSYGYDVFDRMFVSLKQSYDAYGNPVGAWNGAELLQRVYDGGNVVAEHVNRTTAYGFGDPLRHYLWADNPSGGTPTLLAQENIYINQASAHDYTFWVLADVRNSTRDVVRWLYDDKLWHWEHVVYDSYGNIAVSWAADPYYGVMYATAYLNWTNYGYTGEERDAWSGYYIQGERWIDRAVGVWITQDPIGFAAGQTNLYVYVGNSPTNYTDPTGLQTTKDGSWPSIGNNPYRRTNEQIQRQEEDALIEHERRLRIDVYKVDGREPRDSQVEYLNEITKQKNQILENRARTQNQQDANYHIFGNPNADINNLTTGEMLHAGMRITESTILLRASVRWARGLPCGSPLGFVQIHRNGAPIRIEAKLAPPPTERSGRVRTFYHKGNLDQPRLTLSTVGTLEEAQKLDRIGSIHKYEVPEEVYYHWYNSDQVSTGSTLDKNVFITEFLFESQAAQAIQEYKVP
ncbi:MAG: RHS repeat-associated core domain-containing protein [Pirellulales bacterium]